jgi:hypothetical protein
MLKIAKSIPVRRVKVGGKTYYNIIVGHEIVWVHSALIENNMVIFEGNRFYFDIGDKPDGSTIYYLYPGEFKLTMLVSNKYLYVLDGSWIMSEFRGTFYYLIEYDYEPLTVHNRKESFEIKDNKVISVERLDAYEHVDNNSNNIDKEIDLDGAF